MHPTRGRLSCSSLLAVVWVVGCGDGGGGSGAAPDAGKPNVPDNSDDAGTGGNTPSEATYRAECERSCKAQAECLQLSEGQCESECKAQATELRVSCYQEATDEQTCLKTLSCEELKAYVVDGRRKHSVCGEVAQAYFAACTLGAGTIPASCTAMCAKYVECDASEVSQASCEESCTLRATSFHDDSEACGESYLAFIGCTAKADCDEVVALAESNLSPVACNDAVDAVDAACKR